MSTEPKQTSQGPVLTLEAFRECGWKEALGQASSRSYVSMWQCFLDAGNKIDSDDCPSRARILGLFADACSMMLSPDSANEPFEPLMRSRTHRWVVPSDFRDPDIAFFAEVVSEIDDPRLAARLADLVWLRQRPRDSSFALRAIDNYRSIPLTAESWFAGARECWQRARILVAMLGKGSGSRQSEITESVLTAFRAAQTTDDFLGLQLAEFLRDLAIERKERLPIAGRLQRLAEGFDQSGNRHAALDYYDGAAGWYGLGGEEQQSTAMIVAAAECLEKTGHEMLVGSKSSHMGAALLYEKAIQKYRTIPKERRALHRVEERLASLRQRVQTSGRQSLGEMTTIEAPAVDISEVVNESREAVMGKHCLDALATYVNLHPVVDVEDLRTKTIQLLQKHPLQALLATVVMDDDGRVVAKRSGLDLDDLTSPSSKDTIRAEMISTYVMRVHSITYGIVIPGLEVLRLEHRMREGDFRRIAAGSLAVPPGREGLFGKALFAGYEWDFVTAIHILAPQVEHMARFHLKNVGVQTRTLSAEGVESEIGLTALMAIPECQSIWGGDIAFELRALFCDSFGPNIRNDVAHGLFSEDKCRSTTSVYAWWFVLKIVFNSFWSSSRSDAKGGGPQGEDTVGENG